MILAQAATAIGLHYIDWTIVVLYLAGMIMLSVYLSRGQENEADYYLGGNTTGAFPIAISTMATQCSTNSILGAPAFVAFGVGGGLVWLQNELALPLAMIVLMAFLLPMYRKLNIISVYEYLERRFDGKTRLTISIFFQFMRAFSTGVTVYGISLVISYCMGIPFVWSVILLGIVTIVYDSIGGMKAVIYSDVIQMFVLYGTILITIGVSIHLVGGFNEVLQLFQGERIKAIDYSSLGFNEENKDYTFWPMLIGGFFLYISYYGCDQTQVQRELSTKSIDDTNMSLFINGIMRFPLVLTYCFLGVCIGAYAIKNPDFLNLLPKSGESGNPQYNLSVPVFVATYFPIGLIGLFMVGLFSAAMSSLDSTINSLSAVTMEDILKRTFRLDMSGGKELLYSKLTTVFWGVICVIFAFFVGGISDNIIVSINKIGSLVNGPILAVFMMGVLTRKVNSLGAIVGLLVGFVANLLLWQFTIVSWLWWNAIGFVISFAVGYLISCFTPSDDKDLDNVVWSGASSTEGFERNWTKYYIALVVYAVVIFGLLSYLNSLVK